MLIKLSDIPQEKFKDNPIKLCVNFHNELVLKRIQKNGYYVFLNMETNKTIKIKSTSDCFYLGYTYLIDVKTVSISDIRSSVMSTAWANARRSARLHGGSPRDYISQCMKDAWAQAKSKY